MASALQSFGRSTLGASSCPVSLLRGSASCSLFACIATTCASFLLHLSLVFSFMTLTIYHPIGTAKMGLAAGINSRNTHRRFFAPCATQSSAHFTFSSPLRCNRRSRRALARFGCAAPACRGCIYNANAEQRQHARSSGTLARYDDASACVTRAVAGDGGRKSCRHDHGGQGVALAASAKNPAAPCRNISTWISTALFWSRSA